MSQIYNTSSPVYSIIKQEKWIATKTKTQGKTYGQLYI